MRGRLVAAVTAVVIVACAGAVYGLTYEAGVAARQGVTALLEH
ncbi:MAG: hypothetical protein ACRDPT_04785 [Streptomycetales bacterium]